MALWRQEKGIEYFPPLGKDVAYIPSSAMQEKVMFEKTLVLIRIIRVPTKKHRIDKGVATLWKPKEDFQVKRVARNTYLVSFWAKEDFMIVSSKRWYWFEKEIAIIRIWTSRVNTAEDALDSIPQMMALHGIPYNMWSPIAVDCISSVLSKLICA